LIIFLIPPKTTFCRADGHHRRRAAAGQFKDARAQHGISL